MAEPEDHTVTTKHAKLPKDKKKRKEILIGGGVIALLLAGYIWYEHKKNASNSSASTATTAAGTTGQVSQGWSGGYGGGGYGGSGGGNTTGAANSADTTAETDALNSDFSTLSQSLLAAIAANNPGSAGGTTTPSKINSTQPSSGLTALAYPGSTTYQNQTTEPTTALGSSFAFINPVGTSATTPFQFSNIPSAPTPNVATKTSKAIVSGGTKNISGATATAKSAKVNLPSTSGIGHGAKPA